MFTSSSATVGVMVHIPTVTLPYLKHDDITLSAKKSNQEYIWHLEVVYKHHANVYRQK